MPERWTRTTAYAQFDAQLTNRYWSWSARSRDGQALVLTLWTDRFDGATYDGRNEEGDAGKRGNRERLRNLIWARDHCDGRFRAVMAVANPGNADRRETKECYPATNLVMRLVHLDEDTGAFRAEIVEGTTERPDD